MTTQTPEQLLAAADSVAQSIATLKRTCQSPETPLLVALCLASWVSLADCMRLQALSPAVITIPFVLLQVLAVRWFDGPWLQEHGKHMHRFGGFAYVVVSEYLLGMRQVDMPAVSGIIFQHMPTFLCLLCTSTLKETVVTLGVYGVIVWPLADTVWQFNEFLLHGCLICFAAWIKEQLLHLIDQSEALLEVRSMILDTSIAQNRAQLEQLSMKVKKKEETNSQLFVELEKKQADFRKMQNIAESAVSLMGEVQHRQRPAGRID